MRRVYQAAQEAIHKYPQLRDQIEGIVELCNDEIEAGESPEHEIELALEDIRQRVEQYKEEKDEKNKKKVPVNSEVSGQ